MAVRFAARAAAAVSALAGGTLILLSGVAVHSFLLSVVSFFSGRYLGLLPAQIRLPAGLALTVLSLLIALGGFTVILGGLVIASGHASIGRLLIALGGGTSLVVFLLTIAYALVTTGITSVQAHEEYWAGVILAVAARRIAGRG